MRRSEKSTAASSSSSSTEDRISTLPDAILCRILSFVTTKETVATSILSKRWIHLWHHLPNLNFPYINIDAVEPNLLFNQFVYSVILTRETFASNVTNSFNLDIHYDNPHLAYNLGLPHITKWINLVVKRKLEYLRFHLRVHNLDDYNGQDYGDDYFNLPVNIFTCTTLVSLDLRWFRFRVKGFDFDSNGFQFPLLKTLHFKSVNFCGVRDFMLLIAGCPILEDLKISEMVFHHKEEDSLTLQEFRSLSLPKLKTADLVSFHCPCFPVNALSTANYLFIHTLKLQRDILIFHNLTHLELHNRWDLVVQVLHQCPKLQDLKLYKGLSDGMGFEEGHEENWVEPEFVPHCLLSSLRTFAIRDFTDLPSDLMLEQYILKNARNLQTMRIWSTTKQPEMRRTLSTCPMASTTCRISLSAKI